MAAAETWLPIAARAGQSAMWEALRQSVVRTKNPSLRAHVLLALGSFETPKLLRASLDLVLDGELEPSDLRSLSRGWSNNQAVQAVVWDWLVANHERLTQVLGEILGARLSHHGFGLLRFSARTAGCVLLPGGENAGLPERSDTWNSRCSPSNAVPARVNDSPTVWVVRYER